MSYPIEPPIEPMLAKRVTALPEDGAWLYEPKWDGFRTLVFRDGDDLLLQSRDKKPMQRYFPELLDPLRACLPERCVLDGEVVVAGEGGLDFVALQMRIHPAASRVAKLAAETPAAIVVWDLLAVDDEDLRGVPFAERRGRLVERVRPRPPVHLTPITDDPGRAADWFHRFEGAGLDGVMCKDPEGRYEEKRRVMLKVKHERTADCVVAGFRWHKDGEGIAVGSLLLGLYDGGGRLQHVGVAASFTQKKRRELVDQLAPLRMDDLAGHPWGSWAAGSAPSRGPAQSRWSAGKDLSWVPLRPERVVEVRYDHMQGRRFRHTTHVVRWRDDKPPADCGYEQLEVVTPAELQELFAPR